MFIWAYNSRGLITHSASVAFGPVERCDMIVGPCGSQWLYLLAAGMRGSESGTAVPTAIAKEHLQ